MEHKEPVGRELGEGYSYVSLGMSFAAGIILFMAAGLGLDRWLGVTPLFTLVGTLVGAVLSFLRVYWRLQAETEQRKRKALQGREKGP